MALHLHRFALLALVTLSLAACGGAGSDTSSGTVGGGADTGTAYTAGLTKVDMPSGIGSRSPDGRSLRATDDGVYLSLGDSGLATIIAKRTVGRGSTAGWLQFTLPATGTSTYATPTITNETPDAFGILWKAGNRYGYANINNGGTSVNYLDDVNIRVLVPDGPYSTSGREWMLNGATVFRRSTGGGAGTNADARYDRLLDLNSPNLGEIASASDGVGTLYAASGDTLYQIDATGSLQSYDFSPLGFGNLHTLIYRHGRLWIGYADRILYLEGGTVRSFATLTNVLTLAATAPKFCISGTTLYGSDGISYDGMNLPGSASARNYLQSSDNLAGSDGIKLSEIKAAIANGLYCSDSSNGFGPYVYTLGLDIASGTQKLFVITPR